jgi:NAD(P)H-dependent FMN reductase
VAQTDGRRFLFLLGSARQGGNTEALAFRAADALPEALRQDWVDLTSPSLPPFRDERGEATPAPEGRLAEIARMVLAASDIVVVAPVYWYAVPAPVKLLLDHWSGWLEVPGMGFAETVRGKRLWLITSRADPDPEVATLPEAMLRRTATWLGMDFAGALHGIADGRGSIRDDAAAWAAAPRFLTLPVS